MAIKKRNFYDLKAKKKFSTDDYRIIAKTVRGKVKKFAIAISPFSGTEVWTILPSKL
jgi:hypothetical protein